MLSCRPCRERHLRCDRIKPRCQRCRRNNLSCLWTGRTAPSHRVSTSFHIGQVWLPVPPRVDFVFEHIDENFEIPELEVLRNTASTLARLERTSRLRSPGTANVNTHQTANPSHLDIPRSPNIPFLRSEQEAVLLTHYVKHLAAYFDIGDHQHSFATEVPQRARDSQTLLNAVFALSARHLSRTTDFDALVSDGYFQACLQSLIPALDNSNAVTDDAIFAAAVLLRFLEEMEVGSHGSDQQGHRLGTRAIISTLQAKSIGPVQGLRKACYWSAYRQEFSVCMSNQRPMEWALPESLHIGNPVNDHDWVLVTVQKCAKVLDFCFGACVMPNREAFSSLMNEIESWRTVSPQSFDHLHSNMKDFTQNKAELPRIYLASANSAVGHAYNIVLHVLMLAHAPLPKLGPLRRQEETRIGGAIHNDIFALCGIAFVNMHVPCAVLLACMIIELFGDRIKEVEEQSILLKLLTQAEQTHGWPTAHTVRLLEAAWSL